jgi:hypothetical protein
MNAILVANIIEENGKTIRQNNMEIKHKIPIGTLVEINSPQDLEYDDGDVLYECHHRMRAYIVSHDRDCDGTPLYSVGPKGLERRLQEKFTGRPGSEDEKLFNYSHMLDRAKTIHGLDEGSLIIIE